MNLRIMATTTLSSTNSYPQRGQRTIEQPEPIGQDA